MNSDSTPPLTLNLLKKAKANDAFEWILQRAGKDRVHKCEVLAQFVPTRELISHQSL